MKTRFYLIAPLLLLFCLASCEKNSQRQMLLTLANAKQVSTACMLYGHDHGGKFPPSLEALFSSGTLSAEDRGLIYTDPNDPQSSKWVYIPNLPLNSPAQTVLLYSKEPIGGKYAVAYTSGSTILSLEQP